MNQLFYGDNKAILLGRMIPDESVDLGYIDPPFNSNRNYNQIYNNIGVDKAQALAFVDTWVWDENSIRDYESIIRNTNAMYTSQTVKLIKGLYDVLGQDSENGGSLMAYLVAMTVRIQLIWNKLKPMGSFYLHCDPTASHYLKLVCDSIFCGRERGGDFLNEIVWKRTHAHGSANRFGPVHDIILMYTKTGEYTWNESYQDYSSAYIDQFYKNKDNIGYYQPITLTGAGTTQGDSGLEWRGINPSAVGRHWAVPRSAVEICATKDNIDPTEMSTQEKLDLLDKHGFILWPQKSGGTPRFKRYLDTNKGVAIQDVITDIHPISAHAAERLGYPTQKPEALLERIIKASSNEGDTVLDAFCGCGTTVAVAHRLNRKWVGIDITYQSISLILKRLEDKYGPTVHDTITLHGIPKDIESAYALANKKDDRTRKEFEKWAALTYTGNQGIINEKKGADKGVDGRVFFGIHASHEAIISVKSGKNVNDGMIRDLYGTIATENAKMGILITLEKPSKPMIERAHGYGEFDLGFNLSGKNTYPKIIIVTIEEILRGERFPLPAPSVLKDAKRHVDREKEENPDMLKSDEA